MPTPPPPEPTEPEASWEHFELWKAVKKAIYTLPSRFESELTISGVLATDLFAFNASLGATIEEQVIASLNRLNYSFPPDHGAKVVSIILSDPELRADWMAELEEMRTGMLELRKGLAEALRRVTNSDRFDFVAEHRGMFSRLGAPPEQVAASLIRASLAETQAGGGGHPVPSPAG